MNLGTVAFRWCHRNLFATPGDAILSLLFIPLCLWFLAALIGWAVGTAQWSVVSENIRVLMVGTYPSNMMWRPWACAVVLATLVGMSLGLVIRPRTGLTFSCLFVAGVVSAAFGMSGAVAPALAALCAWLLLFGWFCVARWPRIGRAMTSAWLLGLVAIAVILAPSGLERWGGLLMSVLFTLIASVLSVPLGIALALGRRSRYFSARLLCTAYIEVMRSLPLILVVYCIWIVMPLLMPGQPGPDLVRGLIGFTLFFAAYVAEYVRSGLQSVPRGQVEAAQSLGMSGAQVSRDIVLPQAIRVVMPALVGNVLDIFNTVPLLFIIGMTDFLRAGQMILINPQSGGRTYEIYVFMFVVYLLIASAITYGARRLEARMAVGHR